jgi:predicted SnoaL-like aldol condensation-catalyzing enzyme
MRTFMRDAHFVSRQLQMTPEFILTVLLTLGISAKAAIFALMYTVLLRNSQLNEPAILVLQQFLTQSLLLAGFEALVGLAVACAATQGKTDVRESCPLVAPKFLWRHSREIITAVLLVSIVTLLPSFAQVSSPKHVPTSPQAAPMSMTEQRNVDFVLDWWRNVIDARHMELAANYQAEDYIQHNPNVPTGRAAFVQFFSSQGPPISPIPERLSNPPVVRGDKGDLVWLIFEHQVKGPNSPSQVSYAYSFDLLRIQNGKIQEHWDSEGKAPGSPVFVPSTAPPPSKWVDKPSPAEQRNLDVATRFEKDAVEYGHTELMDEILAPDFVEHNRVAPSDRKGLKQFIAHLPDHAPQEIKPEWKHRPALAFVNGPYVVMMWERSDKDPSDPAKEYTRNYFAILRIDNGLIQEIWN